MSSTAPDGGNAGTTLITNLAARNQVSLDGRWRAIVDPYDTGYLDLFGQPSPRGWFRDFTPRHEGDRVEYDFDTSMELAVPGDWNTQYPELHYYEGTVWYRRLFDVEPGRFDGQRVFVNIGAANHTTRVYLDGQELAIHRGGFGPFAVELPTPLSPGSHSLVLMVDNRRAPDRIPAMRADWWNFGGVTRSVDLVAVPPTFLRDAWITMAPDGRIVGGVTADVAGHEARGAGWSAWVELVDLGSSVAVELTPSPEGDELVGSFELDGADVERWAPGRPVLHGVAHRLLDAAGQPVDTITDEVGFRTVSTEGNEILVNGEPTFCKGISIHGEGPSGGRRAHGDADAATLLGWAVDLGANFVRLAHYQHDEAMVRHADRLGLMAWCEIPVYWGIDFADPAVAANARDQLTELVVRDRSRASVALWSVANETLPGEDRNAFLADLAAEARRLDPTRLVTAALLTLPPGDSNGDGEGPAVHIDDPLGEVVDVIGVNQYLGWYYGERDTIAATRWTSATGKPIIFSELGAGAKAGRHGTDAQIWTEEFQAAVYREQLAMIDACDDCAGLSPWILKDFRTPLRVLPGIQDGYNRKGLVSEEGERKLAFDVLADHYRRR